MFFSFLICRNYHVFYYLLAGASEEERKAFHLKKPEEYHYLSQVGSSQSHTDRTCFYLVVNLFASLSVVSCVVLFLVLCVCVVLCCVQYVCVSLYWCHLPVLWPQLAEYSHLMCLQTGQEGENSGHKGNTFHCWSLSTPLSLSVSPSLYQFVFFVFICLLVSFINLWHKHSHIITAETPPTNTQQQRRRQKQHMSLHLLLVWTTMRTGFS